MMGTSHEKFVEMSNAEPDLLAWDTAHGDGYTYERKVYRDGRVVVNTTGEVPQSVLDSMRTGMHGDYDILPPEEQARVDAALRKFLDDQNMWRNKEPEPGVEYKTGWTVGVNPQSSRGRINKRKK
jgi:hypothetical protein